MNKDTINGAIPWAANLFFGFFGWKAGEFALNFILTQINK